MKNPSNWSFLNLGHILCAKLNLKSNSLKMPVSSIYSDFQQYTSEYMYDSVFYLWYFISLVNSYLIYCVPNTVFLPSCLPRAPTPLSARSTTAPLQETAYLPGIWTKHGILTWNKMIFLHSSLGGKIIQEGRKGSPFRFSHFLYIHITYYTEKRPLL